MVSEGSSSVITAHDKRHQILFSVGVLVYVCMCVRAGTICAEGFELGDRRSPIRLIFVFSVCLLVYGCVRVIDCAGLLACTRCRFGLGNSFHVYVCWCMLCACAFRCYSAGFLGCTRFRHFSVAHFFVDRVLPWPEGAPPSSAVSNASRPAPQDDLRCEATVRFALLQLGCGTEETGGERTDEYIGPPRNVA